MVDVEGLASEMLESVEMGCPVHPWTMAARAGYVVRVGPARYPAMTLGPTIVVPDHRDERRAFAVLHELAHATLRNAGLPDPETTVDLVASAALLPRAAFLRDVERTGGNLHALKRLHPHASYEAIARRLVAVCGGAVTVHDVGPRGHRSRTAGAPRRLGALARSLVLEAHHGGEVVGPDEARAYPIKDGAWSRVVLVTR
ncbi:MAG: ImmA/IrrE family metallo-endopeptidase [Nannocystis sp.]|nr:ImmA/IrrE family metallo-endopeptidase [Nannocystis sp.]